MAPRTASIGLILTVGVVLLVSLGLAICFDLPELVAFTALAAYMFSTAEKSNGFLSTESPLRRQVSTYLRPETQPKKLVALLVVLMMACIVLELLPVAMALCGALGFIAIHQFSLHQRGMRKQCSAEGQSPVKGDYSRTGHQQHSLIKSRLNVQVRKLVVAPAPFAHKDASVESKSLDAAMRDVVDTFMATQADMDVAHAIAAATRRCITKIVPEAEVMAVPSGNINKLTACGEKPEIDVVVTVAPHILKERLRQYFLQGKGDQKQRLDKLENEGLHKIAIKTLSDKLNFVRYWRSQYSGPECLIVLLIAEDQGMADCPVLINFTVNTTATVRLASLESTVSASCKALIAMVLRWSRDRGIKNVGRGQFSKYGWALLVVHFMKRPEMKDTSMALTELFKAFVTFYDQWFQKEESMVIHFTPAKPEMSADKSFFKLPFVEDLYQPGEDVAALATTDGVDRMKEELKRACEIMMKGEDAKISQLLERWTPAATTP